MDRQAELRHQLMVTFQAELEEHVNTFDRGLLALEQGISEDDQEELLAELFRAAHSLKGAARAVELDEIEAIAHGLENVLEALQRDAFEPEPATFDLLFETVDTFREAMTAQAQGTRLAPGRVESLLAQLDAVGRGEAPPSAPRGAESQAPMPDSVRQPGETVRVATEKLDRLMESMGELLVARMRTEQHLDQLQTLQRQLTHWQKAWRSVRVPYNHLAAGPWDSSLERDATLSRQRMAPVLDFLGHNEAQLTTLAAKVERLVRAFAGDHNYLSLVTDDLQDEVRRVRMLPIAHLFDPFPRMVRDLAREQGKDVALHVEGAQTEVDRQVLERMKDPLIHLLRNAVDHGIEPPDQRAAAGKPRRGAIHLRAVQKGNTIVLEVADDGAGIDLEAIREAAVARGMLATHQVPEMSDQAVMQLIFYSGLSTLDRVTELSGRGIGLDVVRQNLERFHGLVHVETLPGQGATFTLTLPLTLATSQVLLVEAASQTVAVPTTTIERILRVAPENVGHVEGKPAIEVNGRPVPLIALAQVLELPHAEHLHASEGTMRVILLGIAERRLAFRVDELAGTQDVVVKSLGRQLRRVRNVAGATILGSGQVVVMLNVADLFKSAQALSAVVVPPPVPAPRRHRVLVVDDSITTRTLERNILENTGYEVQVAADGQEAWASMQTTPPDAVVADVAMPRMDGFALTAKIRADDRLRDLPVVLVTSLESQEDKRRGLEAGADAYITKGAFDQDLLLKTIERLVG